MSLHIYLIHDFKNRRGLNNYSLNFMFQFIKFFNEMKPIGVKFIEEKEENRILLNEKFNNNSEYYIEKLKRIKQLDYASISAEVQLDLLKQPAIISLHNHTDSKIYGDIQLDLYSNNMYHSIADVVRKHRNFKQKINAFFAEQVEKKANFRRAYIDEEEEGEEDPRDKIFEYDIEKHKAVKNMIRLVEIEEEYGDLDENMRGYDRELISSWVFDNFKDFIMTKAKKYDIYVDIASFRQFSENKESLGKFYKECIQEILIPIFNVEPIEERIKQRAKEVRGKLRQTT